MTQFHHVQKNAFGPAPSGDDQVTPPASGVELSAEKSPLVMHGTIPGAMPDDDSPTRSVRFKIDGELLETHEFVTPVPRQGQLRDVKHQDGFAALSLQQAGSSGAPMMADMGGAPCCQDISWATVVCLKDPLLAGSVILQCLLPFAGITGAWACNADAALLGQAYGGMAPALFSGAACLRDADRSWRFARQAGRDGASTPSTQEPEQQHMLDEQPMREHSPSRGPVDGWLDDGYTHPDPIDTKTTPSASLPQPAWHPTFTGGLSLAQLASGTISLVQQTVGWTPWMTLPVAGLTGGLCLCCWGACQSMEKPQSGNAQ